MFEGFTPTFSAPALDQWLSSPWLPELTADVPAALFEIEGGVTGSLEGIQWRNGFRTVAAMAFSSPFPRLDSKPHIQTSVHMEAASLLSSVCEGTQGSAAETVQGKPASP
ncbi:unnamed protein product [Rangifer tarandus platyrhynchus]|uniref:Uncharacterized protein n=1 Tax=Rangifer tarandus platyrhynchus TaxID=3082113 RepID=A0AC59Z1E1_RANTA